MLLFEHNLPTASFGNVYSVLANGAVSSIYA